MGRNRNETEWTPGDIDGEGYSDLDVEDDIIYYIQNDNAEGLRSLLTYPDVRNGMYSYCRTTLLQSVCLYRAKKCATALVDGKLGITVDVNRDKLLHHAAWYVCPELVKLFLHHGARTDVRFASKFRWPNGVLPPTGMLPLNVALDATRRLMQLYRQESLFKSIELLCRPSMKKSLDVSKLLVESSNNIEEFAYYYAMEGKLVELAVLLIVARKKVLNGRMMIPQCVSNQILSLTNEIVLVGECKHGELTQIQQKMMSMSSTALLLEVFERAGHTIEEYLQSQQPDVKSEQVEKNVASILEEAGFRLTDGKFEFSLRDWMNYCGFARTRVEFLQTLPGRSSQFVIRHSPRSPLMQQTNASFPLRSGNWSLAGTSAFHGTRALSAMRTNQAPNSILDGHDQTSFDAQVKKGTNAVEQNMPKCLPREKFGYIAMLVKRGLRSSRFL